MWLSRLETRSEKPSKVDMQMKVETQIVSSACVSTRHMSGLPSRVHFQRRCEPKAKRRFGGKNDLLVTGECRSARTCASAGGRANRSALAPAGQAADDCAECRATACHHCCPLAFALQCAADGCGLNPLLAPVYRN